MGRGDVPNIIWCTGYGPELSWIDLPVFEANGEPRQTSGLVDGEPGLYFVGQHFQHSVSSTMIHGVGRDAAFIVRTIGQRCAGRASFAADASSRPVEATRAHVA